MDAQIAGAPSSLLPDEPAPVDKKQRDLTGHFLTPLRGELYDMLMAIRSGLDPQLCQLYPTVRDLPYPLGRCREIALAVRGELVRRIRAPRSRVEQALNSFIRQGGMFRPIWGALRGRYFQNAFQIGGLYVDVSNDTVTVTKPKVEILPMEESGMEAVRDIAHFCAVARLYWEVETYPNLMAPSLAPIISVVGLHASGRCEFISASDYMVALSMRDAFHDAEAWVAGGEAPTPPHFAQMLERVPPDLRPQSGMDPRMAAIEACRSARQAGRHLDNHWRNQRVSDFLRIQNNSNPPRS
ncbi:hypothetical protein [Niveispirillum sp.]|uniref:hypothetical protein n=1 Tax=Niveispirillum sp. TaxID=1917217 RepID=UPI001B609A80|nr:hypothetical protein [Niveispirillum sp.]MBP7334810.1 hypothetical protein [Niveispirillum sp.]